MTFQPGISGNPQGGAIRYQKQASDMLRAAALAHDKRGKVKLRRICDRVVSKAMAGEPWACCLVFDRLDGKAHQSIDNTVTLEAGQVFVDLLRALNDARAKGQNARVINGKADAHKPAANGAASHAPASQAPALPAPDSPQA